MKVLKWLDKNFEKYILVTLLIVIAAALSLQVFMRFVLNSPTFWSDRVAQLSFVISMFFSISYCIRRGSSLKIDLVLKAVPEAAQKVIAIIVKVIVLIFACLLALGAWGTLGQYLERGTTDPALGIRISNLYVLVFIALALMVVRSIQVLFFEFFPEKNPEVLAKIGAPIDEEEDENDKGSEKSAISIDDEKEAAGSSHDKNGNDGGEAEVGGE